MTTVYRVQHINGRGPYRPGWSHVWVDDSRESLPEDNWIQVFGLDVLKERQPGEAWGSAFVSLAQLHAWFSESELQRLRQFGFNVVAIEDARIVAESPHQCLIARAKPLGMDVRTVDERRAA